MSSRKPSVSSVKYTPRHSSAQRRQLQVQALKLAKAEAQQRAQQQAEADAAAPASASASASASSSTRSSTRSRKKPKKRRPSSRAPSEAPSGRSSPGLQVSGQAADASAAAAAPAEAKPRKPRYTPPKPFKPKHERPVWAYEGDFNGESTVRGDFKGWWDVPVVKAINGSTKRTTEAIPFETNSTHRDSFHEFQDLEPREIVDPRKNDQLKFEWNDSPEMESTMRGDFVNHF